VAKHLLSPTVSRNTNSFILLINHFHLLCDKNIYWPVISAHTHTSHRIACKNFQPM